MLQAKKHNGCEIKAKCWCVCYFKTRQRKTHHHVSLGCGDDKLCERKDGESRSSPSSFTGIVCHCARWALIIDPQLRNAILPPICWESHARTNHELVCKRLGQEQNVVNLVTWCDTANRRQWWQARENEVVRGKTRLDQIWVFVVLFPQLTGNTQHI